MGSAELDQQHQRLMDAANAIVMATGPEAEARVTEALRFLALASQRHFQVEERLMAALSYPWLEHHQRAHRGILDQLGGLREKLDAGGKLEAAQLAVHFTMQGWSSKHLAVVDARLARWLARRRRREGPAQELEIWASMDQAECTLGGLGEWARPKVRVQNAAK
jgi:hemerythrin-like metal-binding protein